MKNLPTAKLRIAHKLVSDKYYGPLYRACQSMSVLEEAGFFDDGLESGELNVCDNWLSTPVYKLVENIGRHANRRHKCQGLAVLLTTGAFSPIHKGHLAMMDSAKAAVEEKGFCVVAGYFAAGHDSYVSMKKDGEAALAAPYRNYLCELAVKDSDWLMNDPWASRYAPAELNFTDVLGRLEAYLERHISTNLKLFYVFGGDNSAFAQVFLKHGNGVCINRPRYEAVLKNIKNNLLVKKSKRTIFVEESDVDISSTAIRKGSLDLLPDTLNSAYQDVQKAYKADQIYEYVVRDDLRWATQDWNVPKEFVNEFKLGLVDIFTECFSVANKSLASPKVEIKIYDLEVQQHYVSTLLLSEKQVLNLDVCTNGGNKINVSRLFGLSGGQYSAQRLIARPGYPDINEQMQDLPIGNFLYLDDDIASGSTKRAIESLLPSRCKIYATKTLIEYSRKSDEHVRLPVYDMVDARDFLVGSKAAGLVVGLPDSTVTRAPYLWPYVSLNTRASIPLLNESDIAYKIWDLNKTLFKKYAPELTLKSADKQTQILFRYVGFKSNTPLWKICQWHMQKLHEF